MKNIKIKDVIHLYCDSKFNCLIEFKNLKPVLRPLSTFTIEEFAEICKVIFETDKVIYCTINGYFAVMVDFDDDIDELDEDYRNDYHQRIINAESNDHDNVLSISRPAKMYSQLDLAHGTDDEMRFFVGVKIQGIFVSELCKRGFDIFDLISSGQAIELGKEVASESK